MSMYGLFWTREKATTSTLSTFKRSATGSRTLPVEGQLDPGDEAVPTAERKGDRTGLDLDHLTVDLRKESLDLIDEHTQGGRGRLGSRRPGPPESDEDTEGDDTSRGRAHAGTD